MDMTNKNEQGHACPWIALREALHRTQNIIHVGDMVRTVDYKLIFREIPSY
jgi:hypothetical protein